MALDADRTVILVDLPALRLTETIVHVYDAARTIAALLLEAGCEFAHLVGHSYGGHICRAFATLHPHHVASLTVVGALLAQKWEGSPSLCIVGEDEPPMVRDAANAHVVAGAGHHAHVDNPRAVASILASFLSELR
jgi:pimeloyl-ACP methyl ester carboxylesterase